MFCTKCGTELPDTAKFCLSCGTQVGEILTPAQPGPTLLELSCPSCAGRLQVSPDKREFRCEHCGKGLIVVPHEQTITLRLKPPRKERCELRLAYKGSRGGEHTAVLFTPTGTVAIGSSKYNAGFFESDHRSRDASFQQLETWLLGQGWQKVGDVGSMSVYERWAQE